jgi:L-alanine-DL-glutamate epimerase-like enolase superfamily enzyme
MKITAIETHLIRVPFDMGAPQPTSSANIGNALTSFLVRAVTEGGIEGWGEGFGHKVCPATRIAFETQVAPAVLGLDASAILGISRRLAEELHIFGRNGPSVYARAALDIALWDIAGKEAGQPLWRLFGAAPPGPVPAYASLLRYGLPDRVAAATERALAAGYRRIKLHEVTVPAIAAGRAAAGPDVPLMVDVNCPWTVAEACAMARAFRPFDLAWLEEPVWPPEDHAGLARVRAAAGIPIAAGENAAGLHDFQNLFAAGALDIAQPSVIKLGGITEVLKIAALAEAWSVQLVPHCAYFGPGYLASMHLQAALAPASPFERLFIDLEASPYHEAVLAPGGIVRIPDGPGLGRDPDPAVLARYAVDKPVLLRA